MLLNRQCSYFYESFTRRAMLAGPKQTKLCARFGHASAILGLLICLPNFNVCQARLFGVPAVCSRLSARLIEKPPMQDPGTPVTVSTVVLISFGGWSSWSAESRLNTQLSGWLDKVQSSESDGPVFPVKGCKAVIGPFVYLIQSRRPLYKTFSLDTPVIPTQVQPQLGRTSRSTRRICQCAISPYELS